VTQTPSRFSISIDGQPHQVDDPVITGAQILELAGRRPPDDWRLVIVRRSGSESLRPTETVDLRQPGREMFVTDRSDRTYTFVLDGVQHEWPSSTVEVSRLLDLAAAGEGYRVWQERRGEEDLQLEPGKAASLDKAGVERFYTGKEDTNAGRRCLVLPESDQRYVDDHNMAVEAAIDGDRKGVILKDFDLGDRFDHQKADVLLVLPSGYPDACPDMFYCSPWIKLRDAAGWPEKADVSFDFAGRKWQQWSRHNSDWRAGIDGIHTMIQRINAALRVTK
jgi:hypothetical protein